MSYKSSGDEATGKFSLANRKKSISSLTGQVELTVTEGLRCFI